MNLDKRGEIMFLSRRIKESRIKQNLTQQQLGDLLNVSSRYFRRNRIGKSTERGRKIVIIRNKLSNLLTKYSHFLIFRRAN